ncbi:MAG: ATP synthase F1 subunit gamma [Anaerolineales bacterium]
MAGASTRDIKRRINSVENIGQVTRALEAVSASKARQAQRQAERSRDYARAAWEILVNLAGQPGSVEHPLLYVPPPEDIKTIDIVLFTSDRGLAGAYNLNIIRVAEEWATDMNTEVRWVAVGRKGRDFLVRARRNIIAEFTALPAEPSIQDIEPIGRMVVDDFLQGKADEVFVAYTDFINVLTQRPAVAKILPLEPLSGKMANREYYVHEPDQTVQKREYIYEPSADAILDDIVPRFVTLLLYQSFLEANASEHSARMIAMRNASDNAESLVDDLTLEYNKARQTAITNEMLDIVGGVEALSGSGGGSSAADTGAKSGNGASQRADAFIRQQGDELQAESDDLTRIEGIGPKTADALIASGYRTFADIANAAPETLERVVKVEHGVQIVGDAATWPKQARYLVQGDESGLKTYQDRLVGGREPEG